jgi:DNA-binding NtrC family response regulator
VTVPTLLVIDDEPAVGYSFRRVFGAAGTEVLTAETAAAGLEQLRAARPDVVVLDLQLPDANGLDVFREIQAADPKRPVVFITAHGTTDTAIEAMKRGAFDYLVKPVDFERVRQVLGRAFEAARLMQVPAVLPEEAGPDRIVGRSPVMQEMCKLIGRVAPQDVNVLILGESGTGKELVARALYQHSKRAGRPFLAINCAAIPEGLLESELFGHEAGAFTGAAKRHVGKFEQAQNGTLLLDEVGEMSPPVQAKMLRVLQEQRFERLGGSETVRTDVRVLAATNADLERLAAAGKFRKDLFYRLNGVVIRVPPLRDRVADVPELAHHFLFEANRLFGLDFRGFSPEAVEALQRYAWPGNVRELRAAVQQAMLNCPGRLLTPEFLPAAVRGAAPTVPAGTTPQAADLDALIEGLIARGEAGLYQAVLQWVERRLLARVLRETHGSQVQASELLGLHRATLRHKLRELGITLETVVTPPKQPG